MKCRGILAGAIALALSCSPALAQTGQGSSPLTVVKGGTGASSASAARTSLGLAIGSNVEAWDADLDCIAANSTAGLHAYTGAGTCAFRTLTAPAAGFTITNPAGTAGNPTFVLANDLAALEALASTGFAVRTASDTWAQRTITGTANAVCVTNGDGVSGNPTLDICSGFLSTAHSWAGVQTFAAPIATGTFDVQGTLKLSAFVTSTQIVANANNFTATDGSNTCSTKLTLRISSDASRNISGLSCGQAEGDVRIIHNVGAQNIVLTNQDTNSTAANRFLFGGGDMTVGADTSVALRYDGVASRWRAITTPGAGAGGGVTSVTCDGVAITTSGTCPPRFGHVNCTLAASAGSSALTIALKDNSGSDPSASSPCTLIFRNVTGGTGSWTKISVTAAASLVVSSGSTLGVTSSTPFRLWVVAFNDAGTFRLGVINCSTPGQIFPLNEGIPASSTAEGGAGAADSAGVIYTGTAVSAKAFLILGYIEWNTSGVTAGTWTTSNLNFIQTFGPGIKKPGDVVQWIMADAVAGGGTTTTTIPFDNTIPQITEGAEFIAQAIVPTSAANTLQVDAGAFSSCSVGANQMMALFQDATANALSAMAAFEPTATATIQTVLSKKLLAGTSSSTTFRIRMGCDRAGTFTFGGSTAAAIFGGVGNNYIRIQEIMG